MSDNNGDLTVKEKAIKDGKVCHKCVSRLPETPIVIPLQPAPGKIQVQNQVQFAFLVVCGNPKSEHFQMICNFQKSCDSFEAIPQPSTIAVPKSVKNRMGG